MSLDQDHLDLTDFQGWLLGKGAAGIHRHLLSTCPAVLVSHLQRPFSNDQANGGVNNPFPHTGLWM